MIRRVPLVLQIPEECIDEVREFFERRKGGTVTLQVLDGEVMGTDVRSVKRGQPEEPAGKPARMR